MIVSIHQPNFIPWLGYFSKIKQSDVFIILDTVDLQIGNANSITTRTKIKTQQGELWLTVPIKKTDNKIIQSILIDNKQPWQKKMLKTIQMSYSKAPHFQESYAFLENILNISHEYLSDLNTAIILNIVNWLGIETQIIKASTLPLADEDKNQRIIDLVKATNGNCYLSGNGARQYNDEAAFNANGIELKYTSFKAIEYPQMHGEFIQGLSILDLMMNISKADIQNMIK